LAVLSVPAFAAGSDWVTGPGIDSYPSIVAHVPNATAFGGMMYSAGSFTDVFNFTTDAAGTLSVSMNTANIDAILSLSSLVGTFSGNTGVTILPGNSTYSFSGVSAGAYSLTVTGYADGAYGGGYNGALTLAVPEPGSYAMFLAGIGLLGLIVRRRTSLV
jgi:hypothetical protein